MVVFISESNWKRQSVRGYCIYCDGSAPGDIYYVRPINLDGQLLLVDTPAEEIGKSTPRQEFWGIEREYDKAMKRLYIHAQGLASKLAKERHTTVEDLVK